MSVVTVVIPHFNSKEIIKQCLDSLLLQTYTEYSIVVIDNGSTDGSSEMITQEYSDQVILISLGHNTGFAYAVNRGINEAIRQRSDYVFVLNNDTVLEKTCMELLVKGMQSHLDAGSVQPKIINAHHPDRIDSMGIVITRDMSALNRNQSVFVKDTAFHDEEIFGPTACAALYRITALIDSALGHGEYFDNDYFAYYEDVDLAFRMRYQKYRSWCINGAILHHHHSATGINYSEFKSFHIHRNHLYNMIKDMPFPQIASMLWRIPLRYLLLVSSVFKKKGPAHRLQQGVGPKRLIMIVLRSWYDFLKHLPLLLKKRKRIMTACKVSLHTARSWFDRFGVAIDKTIYEERI